MKKITMTLVLASVLACFGTALAASTSPEGLKSEATSDDDGNNFTIGGMTYHPSENIPTFPWYTPEEGCGLVKLEKVSEKFIAKTSTTCRC